MTKILVSRGYGAGWSTWNEKMKEVAEYAPIIDFLEAGGDRMELCNEQPIHPLIKQIEKDLGVKDFYAGGADGLTVVEVGGHYRIDEYDGFESVMTSSDFW